MERGLRSMLAKVAIDSTITGHIGRVEAVSTVCIHCSTRACRKYIEQKPCSLKGHCIEFGVV